MKAIRKFGFLHWFSAILCLLPLVSPIAVTGDSRLAMSSQTASMQSNPAIPSQVSTFTAIADTFISSKAPTTNYGTLGKISVGATSPGTINRALVRFDIPTTLGGATVQSASLELYLASGSSSPPTVNIGIYRIEQSWNETKVTWATQPKQSPIGKVNPVGLTSGYYKWDVTALVQGWLNGSYPNDGLILRVEPEGTLGLRDFNSREASVNRPRLVVNYSATTVTDDPQVKGLRRLEANSAVAVSARFRNGIPAYIHASVPAGGAPGDPFSQARAYLNAYKDLYRLTNSVTQFRLERQVIDQDYRHVVLQQMYAGIPVYGAELSIHIRGDQFVSSNGAYLPDLNISTTPAILIPNAEQAAKADALKQFPGVTVTIGGQTALVIFDRSLWTDIASKPRLAWRINLRAGQDDWTYFVDAQTGGVLHRLDLSRTELDLEIFTGNNDTSGNCWNLFDDPSTKWFDEDGRVVPANQIDSDGWNAYNEIRQVYNYYRNVHSRDSYDNDDSQIELFVHVDQNWANARWVGGFFCDLIEFGDGFVAQDVVGHEFTHGVTEYEGNMVYEYESGALNESLSDTFGEFIEAYANNGIADWLVGEDIVGRDPLRDMANPPHYGDPDNVDPNHSGDGIGLRPLPDEIICDSHDQNYNDCGYVHTNNGILNKAAWLISSDADHIFNGIPVHGLGIATAEQIFYKAMTHYLNTNSQFMDMREAMLEATEELYSPRYVEICTVKNAYASVGLGNADVDCDGLDNPIDSDDDGDSVPDSRDNCPLIANFQIDTDHDGLGDACDPDLDGDGVVNGNDNCPQIANPSQLNTNGTGQGDACYDPDGDGIPLRHGNDTIWDNCPTVNSTNIQDHNNNGLGDVCDNNDDEDSILDDGDGSGTPGDNFCHGGNNKNCDDNAPFINNNDQADADNDGVGDVVDNCPFTPNPYVTNIYPPIQVDSDGDGIGDSCDSDDDNDGVLDSVDNCPIVYNPIQTDINHNGIGGICDQDEAFMLSSQAKQVAFFIEFHDQSPVVLPIFPCWADGCPGAGAVLPAGQRAFVSMNMPKAFGVMITDDSGAVIKQDRTGQVNKLLSFAVNPSYRFDFNSMGFTLMGSDMQMVSNVDDSIRYAQRPMYYIELWPTADTVIGQSYQVEFAMASFVPNSTLYLPFVRR